MRALAHVNPLYYAVQASRVLSTGTIASATVAQAFAVMAVLTALACWWAARAYRGAVT